jgi:hypothetical protein
LIFSGGKPVSRSGMTIPQKRPVINKPGRRRDRGRDSSLNSRRRVPSGDVPALSPAGRLHFLSSEAGPAEKLVSSFIAIFSRLCQFMGKDAYSERVLPVSKPGLFTEGPGSPERFLSPRTEGSAADPGNKAGAGTGCLWPVTPGSVPARGHLLAHAKSTLGAAFASPQSLTVCLSRDLPDKILNLKGSSSATQGRPGAPRRPCWWRQR